MKKLYVLVNTRLPYIHQSVQAGHAVAQYCIEHPEEAKEWGNGTIVYLGVDGALELEKNIVPQLIDADVKFSYFVEPDWQVKQLTAIACVGEELFPDLRTVKMYQSKLSDYWIFRKIGRLFRKSNLPPINN